MTRVVWDALSTRTYETGIDRCVIYPSGKPGSPWPGIVKIQEQYIGSTVSENYLDGTKYRNTIGNAEFKAKISSFTRPYEFYQCDGILEIEKGLFVADQPRQMFGMTYRTIIGNDVVGDSYGYKVHILYNVIASPIAASYSTESNNPSPTLLEWDLTTVPYRHREFSYFRSGGDQTKIDWEKLTYRPVSHMIVDTRAIGPSNISILEKVLYGTDLTEPELPTPSELLELIR